MKKISSFIQITTIVSFLVLISMQSQAFAERTPDMDNAGIQMFFCGHLNNAKTLNACLEKETYQNYPWYGKINVMIFAPAYNTDPYEVEFIGDTEDNRIGAYTDVDNVNGPCKFAETGPDTGLFLGRVKLTGSRFDVDGKGTFGIRGGNSCDPSNKGSAEEAMTIGSSSNGRITVFWEYNEDQIISKSANYSWTLGKVELDKKVYNPNDTVKVKFYDVDVYDEKRLDLDLRAYSDSDTAGITLDVYFKFGSSDDPGITFELTNKKQSPNRVFVNPGDTIYVEYIDRTLPRPYAKTDEIEIIGTAQVTGLSISSFSTSDIVFKNSMGEKIINPLKIGQQVLITNDIINELYEPRSFASIIQVKDSKDRIVHLAWLVTSLQSKGSTTISHTWVPKEAGTYMVETYVWRDLLSGLPLAEMKQKMTIVK